MESPLTSAASSAEERIGVPKTTTSCGAADSLCVAPKYLVPFFGIAAQREPVTVEDVFDRGPPHTLWNVVVVEIACEVCDVVRERHGHPFSVVCSGSTVVHSSATASPTSSVEAVPPTSGVRYLASTRACSTAASMRRAVRRSRGS